MTAGSVVIEPDYGSRGFIHTILLVEDEAFVRDAACEILSGEGFRVLKAATATEALHTFHNHAGFIHLLITDVVLPDQNGCDLAVELSNLGGGVKAIFVSGYPENLVTKRGVPRHDWSYLPKPFSANSLIQKVREALPREKQARGETI